MSDPIKLVPLGRHHLPATLVWMNNAEVMRLLHREHLITPEEHNTWFKKLSDDSSCLYFAIEVGPSRRHVGNIWLAQMDRRNLKAEVRILLGESRGAGYGSKAIELLSKQSLTKSGLNRLYAYVLDFNPPAVRAFEKAGFVKEGLLKQDRKSDKGFHNTWLLARTRRR